MVSWLQWCKDGNPYALQVWLHVAGPGDFPSVLHQAALLALDKQWS